MNIPHLKKGIAILGAAAVISGGKIADNQINPYVDTGTSYRMEVSADIPQNDHIEIAKDTPAVTLSRWNDEERVTVTPKLPVSSKLGAVQSFSQATRSLFSKKIEYSAGDVTAFVQPAASSSDFDIDFTLASEPTSNVFQYQFSNSDDLTFYYQPALNKLIDFQEYSCTETECRDINGILIAQMPENGVGSYAVYSKTKRNHEVGKTNYGTGKLFHIYRPKAIDANGSTTWASLSMNDKTGVLSVTVPQEFLDGAVYPVTVDPTFGYTSIGALGAGRIGARGSYFTSNAEDGNVSSISWYTYSATVGQNNKALIFSVSGTSLTLLSDGASDAISLVSANTNNWTIATFSNQPSIISSTKYALGVVPDSGSTFIKVDTAASGSGWNDASYGYSTLGNTTDSQSNPTFKYSIYATYTASGGGGGSTAPDDGLIIFE